MGETNCAMCCRGPVSSNSQQAVACIAQAPLSRISQATSEQLTTQRHCHIPGFRWVLHSLPSAYTQHTTHIHLSRCLCSVNLRGSGAPCDSLQKALPIGQATCWFTISCSNTLPQHLLFQQNLVTEICIFQIIRLCFKVYLSRILASLHDSLCAGICMWIIC